jgi:replication-associated recombination protein RarA
MTTTNCSEFGTAVSRLQTTNYDSPSKLEDFYFSNDRERKKLADIVYGRKHFPFASINGILLWGTFGSGKTTLARLLPSLIEQHAYEVGDATTRGHFIDCRNAQRGSETMKQLEKIVGTFAFFTKSRYHYVILDEVDNLTALTQRTLKSIMNVKNAVFILTTNYVNRLDGGVFDRCHWIEMNGASDEELVLLALRIANDRNVLLDDNDIADVVQRSNGSMRRFLNSIEDLVWSL